MGYQSPTLLEQLDRTIEAKHYSPRTGEAYRAWVVKFVRFCGTRHPRELGKADVERYLSGLATERKVASSTQQQALAAILFLYRHVLHIDLPWLDDVVRAKPRRHLPVVLSRTEVRDVMMHLHGTHALMAMLLYGADLRLLECCRLRVKDLDFDRRVITVRQGKGGKDRVSVLPAVVVDRLRIQLEQCRRQHQADLRTGAGWVELPDALHRKYPNAGREWPWQWVFPATRIYTCRITGQRRRHHFHETALQRAVREAVLASGIGKRASCHTFRHSFANAGATTSTRPPSNAPFAKPCSPAASASVPAATPSATASRRTCSRTVLTSAPSRNCSDMRASPRRRSTRMCSDAELGR